MTDGSQEDYNANTPDGPPTVESLLTAAKRWIEDGQKCFSDVGQTTEIMGTSMTREATDVLPYINQAAKCLADAESLIKK